MSAAQESTGLGPKLSRLGWDMDHVWLVRDGLWVLEGEVRGPDGWRALRALVRIEDGAARFLWEGAAGPYAAIVFPEARSQAARLGLVVEFGGKALEGALDVRGVRQHLRAQSPEGQWSENAFQRPDGSVEVFGNLEGVQGLTIWQWTLRVQAHEEIWTLPATVAAEIKVAARAGAPIEQCGLLVGNFETREILRQVTLENIDQSEDHFTIDPRAQFRVSKELRGSGTEVVGSWHSHPYSPARLSDEDIAFAQDETALYAVVSLMEPASPVLNLWKVEAGKARLVPLRVRPD